MGRLLDPAQFSEYYATLPQGPRTDEGWALVLALPDVVVRAFEAAAGLVATDVFWLASPRNAAYAVLAMQVGEVQVRAFAPLADNRVAQWAREACRRGRMTIAVEVESPRRLALFEAKSTSFSAGALGQALDPSRQLAGEERSRDLVDALRRMCMPSAVSDVIPGRRPKQLYVVVVDTGTLDEAIVHFGIGGAGRH